MFGPAAVRGLGAGFLSNHSIQNFKVFVVALQGQCRAHPRMGEIKAYVHHNRIANVITALNATTR
jgi:hypothetical protein